MNTSYLKWGKNIIFILFILGIGYFFTLTILKNYEQIQSFDFTFKWLYLFASFVFYIIWYISLGILWKFLLPKEPKVSWREIFYINSVSWISKYLPGKVAMIITKVLYLQERGISKKRSFISCIYEHIFQIITSFLISFPFIIYYFLGTENNNYIFLSAIFFLGFFIAIHPFIFNNGFNILLKIVKKEKVDKDHFLSFLDILKYIIGYSCSMILKGLGFVFFVMSITSIGWNDIPFLIFAWIFAGVVGIVSIFAPNGLGVREGVLAFLLQFIMPVEISIIISIASRLWSSIADGIIGIYVGFEKLQFKKQKKEI